MRSSYSCALLATVSVGSLMACANVQRSQALPVAGGMSTGTHTELLVARETVWRAFFGEDRKLLKHLLGPDLIAIQPHQERWESQAELIELARQIQQQDVKVLRLEFPHTKFQILGDVAILYYTYAFETGAAGRSVTIEGRGTEVFARRNGKWIDVGWHLDSGAFVRRNDAWERVSSSSTTEN